MDNNIGIDKKDIIYCCNCGKGNTEDKTLNFEKMYKTLTTGVFETTPCYRALTLEFKIYKCDLCSYRQANINKTISEKTLIDLWGSKCYCIICNAIRSLEKNRKDFI